MIGISSLEQYFPQANKALAFKGYTFMITLRQDEETFLLNLKIRQRDTKEEHLIKFRIGIGKDKPKEDASHMTDEPHFEIDIYKREKEAFSTTAYFTFTDTDDKKISEYAKGTVVVIGRIIKRFVEHEGLDADIIHDIIYLNQVLEELSDSEPALIKALYDCYLKSKMIVREDGQTTVIKTAHNLKKYLGVADLDPLVIPLLGLIEKK